MELRAEGGGGLLLARAARNLPRRTQVQATRVIRSKRVREAGAPARVPPLVRCDTAQTGAPPLHQKGAGPFLNQKSLRFAFVFCHPLLTLVPLPRNNYRAAATCPARS